MGGWHSGKISASQPEGLRFNTWPGQGLKSVRLSFQVKFIQPSPQAKTNLSLDLWHFSPYYPQEKRGWRMRAAVSHIGSSILSSSVTTIVASLPLCFTTIQLFAKFGQIMAINTAVSMFFTFTICVALLRTIAPAKFRSSLRASCIATVAMGVFIGMGCLLLYIISLKGVEIPGPGGEPLFDVNS